MRESVAVSYIPLCAAQKGGVRFECQPMHHSTRSPYTPWGGQQSQTELDNGDQATAQGHIGGGGSKRATSV
jgi:hypothetical protein